MSNLLYLISILDSKGNQNQPCFCWQLWQLCFLSKAFTTLVRSMVRVFKLEHLGVVKWAVGISIRLCLLKDVLEFSKWNFTPTFEHKLLQTFAGIVVLRWDWGNYTHITLTNLRPSTTWQNVADRLLRSGAANVFFLFAMGGQNPCGVGGWNLRSVGRKAWETCTMYWVNIRVIY